MTNPRSITPAWTPPIFKTRGCFRKQYQKRDNSALILFLTSSLASNHHHERYVYLKWSLGSGPMQCSNGLQEGRLHRMFGLSRAVLATLLGTVTAASPSWALAQPHDTLSPAQNNVGLLSVRACTPPTVQHPNRPLACQPPPPDRVYHFQLAPAGRPKNWDMQPKEKKKQMHGYASCHPFSFLFSSSAQRSTIHAPRCQFVPFAGASLSPPHLLLSLGFFPLRPSPLPWLCLLWL